MIVFTGLKQLCRVSVLMAGMMAASASYGATVELITNGGFEDGNTGFTTEFNNVSPGLPGLASVSVLSGNYFGLSAHTGSSFLAVNGRDRAQAPDTVWSQDVSLVSGTQYTFSFQLGGTSTVPQPVGQVSVQLDGNEIVNASAPASASYLSFGTTFTAASTGTFALSFIEQSLGFGGNDYGLDQISLTYDDDQVAPVPLPAGGFLLLSALGLGVVTRRRSKTG